MLTGKTSRQLILNKGNEKFVFRFETGAEDQLMEVLGRQAESKKTDFDWFDAAVLSFKLAQTLVKDGDEVVKKNSPRVEEFVSCE